MATQTELLPPSYHLDRRSREAGRRGVAKARVALAQAQQRAARHHPADSTSHDTAHHRGTNHATAA